MYFRLLVICSIFAACKTVQPTEDYPHSAILDNDGKVKLYWKYDDVNITFEVHGNTTGWVGVGISPNGAMTGADIIVGWVVEGKVTITDRHGVGNTFPPLDPEQNIEVLDGMESDGWTVIKFKRQIAACEPENDLPITGDTLKIIYAFGETEPSDGSDLDSSQYHGASRGSKSLLLLEVSGADESNFPEGETHMAFDLLNDKFEIPSETTYYNCRLFKIPEFTEKQHVVKVEPVIQPGNELFVHHMLVYQCVGSINVSNSMQNSDDKRFCVTLQNPKETASVGANTQCYGSDMPPDFVRCSFVIQAWAIGGAAMYYPKHAGFPLGDTDSPRYVVLETHYDNPEGRSGVIDSSGLRLTHTSELREFDAGIISAGHAVTGIQHIIPPNAESFLSHGECSANCLQQGLKLNTNNTTDRLNIFGVLLHSHLLGTGLTLRHIRNTTELPYVAKDDAYDFNYQETRRLSEEREVLPGDSLQVICDYKTKGVRTEVSMGGLDTKKEMCTAFIYYYPKISLTFCETAPEFTAFLNYFGIDRVVPTVGDFGIYNDLNHLQIIAPLSLAGLTVAEHLNLMTWNEETNKQLETDLRDMIRVQNCRATQPIESEYPYPAPVIDLPYVEEQPICYNDTSTSTIPAMTTESQPSMESTTFTESQPSMESTAFVETTKSEMIPSTLGGEMETTTGAASKLGLSLWLFLLAFLSVLFL